MPNKDLSPDIQAEKTMVEHTTQPTSIVYAQPIGAPDEPIRRFIRAIAEGERIDTEKWLSTLDKLYDEWKYPSPQRIAYTVPILNEEQKTWYEQNKNEINDDWRLFCERFKQNISNFKPIRTTVPSADTSTLTDPEVAVLEDIIDAKFDKYSGVGDAKNWLLHTMNQFKACRLRRDNQFEAIPLLLEGDAYLWYVENVETILNFEVFSKLFLQQFKPVTPTETSSSVGTGASATTVPDNSSISHLQRTVADDIIKRPTYFRGSQDDVLDWLEKLEQRFRMANWDDELKLRYISIHLQEDAYRWWIQASERITSWSRCVEEIKQAFGSTKMKELAFEQLRCYKQTINQSVMQYYDKVMELCRRIDPSMSDTMKLQYLMAGVKESLKLHIALRDPQSTELFLSHARKIEDTLALINVNYDSSEQGSNQDVQLDQRSTLYSMKTNPEINRQQSNNQESKRQASSSNEVKKIKFDDTSRSNASNYHASKRKLGVCYTCGTPGHYARDCTRSRFRPLTAAISHVTSKEHINESFSSVYSSSLYVCGKINGKSMQLMIDTGASRTFVSSSALQAIHFKQFNDQADERVFLADGRTSIVVGGEVDVPIQFGETTVIIRASVVKDLCADCILGMDFIEKYQMIINMQYRTISIFNGHNRVMLSIYREVKRNDLQCPYSRKVLLGTIIEKNDVRQGSSLLEDPNVKMSTCSKQQQGYRQVLREPPPKAVIVPESHENHVGAVIKQLTKKQENQQPFKQRWSSFRSMPDQELFVPNDKLTSNLSSDWIAVEGMNACRNRSRNLRRRKGRYKYKIIRNVSNWVKIHHVKHVLYQLRINYVHLKIENGKVVIGLKTPELVNEYENSLQHDVFDKMC